MSRLHYAIALAALMALVATGQAAAQFGAMGGRAAPQVPPRREDVPYIRCQACELLAKHGYKQVREMLKSATPSKPVAELAVIEAVEKLATSWQPQGEWITRLHIEEAGGKLLLKDMGQPAECGEVCRTVELVAEELLGEHDTDMAEALYTGKRNRAQFNNWLCYELSGACLDKPGPVPQGRVPSPAFKPRAAGDPNLERMMKEMEASGLKGTMYNRDEMLKMAEEMGGVDAGAELLAGNEDAAADEDKTEL